MSTLEKWEKRGGTLKKRGRMGTRGIREEGRCRGEIRRFLLFLLRRQLLHYRFLSVPQIEERKSRREKNKSGKRLVIERLESQGRKRFGESKGFAWWWEEEEVQRTEDKSSLSRHAGCALFMPREKRRQQQKRNPLHLTNQPGFSSRHPTTSSHIQAKEKSPRRGLPPFNPFPPPSFLNPHVYTNFQHPLFPLDLPQDKKGERNLVGERKARWKALPRREKRVNALPTSPLALEPGVV